MRLLRLCLSLLVLASTARAVEVAPAAALAPKLFGLDFSPVNPGNAETSFSVTPGTVWKGAGEERYVVLRSAEIAVPAHASATVTVPAACLSPATVWKPGQPVSPVGAHEARLEPLLAYLAKRNDIPRETSQLAVFALLNNIGFADWQKFRAGTREEPPAAPNAELAVALDALSILRTIAPATDFALASDGALKLRALHDPILRPKALQLYGLVIPGDAAPGAVVPDLGQLLHTKPGDNCPICQMRAQMQKAADIP
jgi:hypothetical protein